jgi:molybdopterin-binding protein
MLSARNQLKGKIKAVKVDGVMAEIVITVGNNEVVSLISRGSADALKLKVGDEVTAIIKATEVIVSKE